MSEILIVLAIYAGLLVYISAVDPQGTKNFFVSIWTNLASVPKFFLKKT